MILFNKDYDEYEVGFDYNTTNKSFLEMASLLKSMGVKNYRFMLALHQPELSGLSPFDASLSTEIKVKMAIEAKKNIWYYFRECVRVPASGAPRGIPLRLNRGILAMVWLFFNHIDSAVAMPRQTGKSTTMNLLYLWLLYLGGRGTWMGLITKDNPLRIKNVTEIKRTRALLPPFMIEITKNDPDNQSEFKALAPHLDNHWMCAVGQTDRDSANKIFRGFSLPCVFWDEFAFIPNVHLSYSTVMGASGTARNQAKASFGHYGTIHATTTADINQAEGKYAYELFHDGATWDEAYYDSYDVAELTQRIRANLKSSTAKTLLNLTFSHRQLGYSDEWALEYIINTKGSAESLNVDLFNIWISTGGESPFTKKILKTLRESFKDPLHKTFDKYGMLTRWYKSEFEIEKILRTESIVLGLDTSQGIGRDAISGTFLRAEGLEVLGTFRTNRTMLKWFEATVLELMIKYKNITLIPENKNTGVGLVDSLLVELPLRGEDPFKRIFNYIVHNPAEHKDLYHEACRPLASRSPEVYVRAKQYFGYMTTSKSRKELFETTIKYALDNAADVAHDKDLIEEISGLRVIDGRLDHDKNGHDDTVVSWLLSHWLIRYGQNLKWYGIDSSRIAAKLREKKESHLSAVELYQAQQQQRLIEEANQVTKLIMECTNPIVFDKLELQLNNLTRRITVRPDEDSPLMSMDVMLNKAKEVRERMQLQRNRDRRREAGNANGYMSYYG